MLDEYYSFYRSRFIQIAPFEGKFYYLVLPSLPKALIMVKRLGYPSNLVLQEQEASFATWFFVTRRDKTAHGDFEHAELIEEARLLVRYEEVDLAEFLHHGKAELDQYEKASRFFKEILGKLENRSIPSTNNK